ncbi:reverse transcriptase [Plasmopara halstedii]|uniref:Reverse transcriptase n=1 Tax=Plasmopara halstedii TaxID=4781 RepID=A0A0N7L6L8_PLAHL|nr:reverse transcriptase [Plasmopara halstedii]CEG44635.1 reverse transcriptase [Plasmopara halstedii]|eukprot:XP_024581004.1 reverse transcriptase [Plasmopara halstedii]
MLAARSWASTVSTVDDGVQLYTLVNGLTGEEDGNVRLEAMSAVDDLLELDEMSLEKFGRALKAGDLAEVVIVRPDEEIKSSSLPNEAGVEDTKRFLNARSGSLILRNLLDPYYLLLNVFQDVVSKDPPSDLPPDRHVRHEINLVPGTKYCVTR